MRRKVLGRGLIVVSCIAPLFFAYGVLVLVCPNGPLPGGRALFSALYRTSPSKDAVFRAYAFLADSFEVERNRHNAYLVERAAATIDKAELGELARFFLDQERLPRAFSDGGAIPAQGNLISELIALMDTEGEDARLVSIAILIEYLRVDGALYKPVIWIPEGDGRWVYHFNEQRSVALNPTQHAEIKRLLRVWWGHGERWPAIKKQSPWEGSPFAVKSVA